MRRQIPDALGSPALRSWHERFVGLQHLAHFRVRDRDTHDNDRLALFDQKAMPGKERLCRETHIGRQPQESAHRRNVMNMSHEFTSNAAT